MSSPNPQFRFNPLTGQLDLSDTSGGGGGGGPQVSFYSYLAATLANATGDSTVIDPVPFDTTSVNLGNGFDVNTGYFTCPQGGAGNYVFSAVIYLTNLASDHTAGAGSFTINGQTYKAFELNPFAMSEGTDLSQTCCSGIVALAEGDTVSMSVLVGPLGTKTVGIGGQLGISNFSGWLLQATQQPGGGITQIDGDTGSATGSLVAVQAGLGNNNGQTVKFGQGFANSLLLYLTDSNQNTILGTYGGGTVTGSNNTGLGYSNFSSLTSGSHNTGLGWGVLDRLLTGSFNLGFGVCGDQFPAGYNYTGAESSNIVLLNKGVTGESNAIRIGVHGSGLGQQDKCFVAGVQGVTLTTMNPQPVVIDPVTGQFGQGSATPAGAVAIGSLQYYANAAGDSALTGDGWLKCNGAVLAQATYTTLFAQVGLINPPGQFWLTQTSGTASTFSTVVYGNGVYVAAGASGLIYSSTDSKTWVKRASISSNGIFAGTYTTGTFLLSGASGQILTSTDGTSWKTKLPGISSPVANVGNMLLYTTQFVGAGSGPILATSTDASIWTGKVIPFVTSIYSLAFGNSLYVAGSSLGQVMTSTDATTWTIRTAATTSSVQALVYGTKWVAGGQGGMIKTSTDAISWTAQTSGTSSSIFSLTYGNSLYLYGGVGGVLATSTDAVTWTARTSVTTSTISSITFGAVYCYGGGGGRIASSTDAITWTNRTSNTTSSILSMIYSGALYVYATAGGGLGTSTDATTWVARTSGVGTDLCGLAWDGALYHAVGNNVNLTSTDAITWTPAVQYIAPQSLSAAGFGNGLFLVGGTGGVLETSTDGLTWTAQTSGSTAPINGLGYGAGVYVLAANGGYLASSTDAITWTARSSFTTQTLSTVTFGSLFVMGGAQSVLLTSTDGTTWAEEPVLNPSNGILGLAYNSGTYVLAGGGGMIYTSTDAVTWVTRTSNTTSSIQSLVSGGGLFVGVGVGGLVVNSYNAYPYDTSTQFQLPSDSGLGITYETNLNFSRSLYIKAA